MRWLYRKSYWYRQLRSAWWNYKYRTWVRFAEKHLLWVKIDQEFIKERRNWNIWKSNV